MLGAAWPLLNMGLLPAAPAMMRIAATTPAVRLAPPAMQYGGGYFYGNEEHRPGGVARQTNWAKCDP